jgi:prevent-host-death family protein
VEQLTTGDLRNRLAEVLKRVNAEGIRFVVTFRGRPVAALVPLDASDRVRWTPLAEVRARLVRSLADSALLDELVCLREQTTNDLTG